MRQVRLLEPVRDGASRWVKFFNGRLLTGEDLAQEQTADREARARLATAIGDGVIEGLEVTESSRPNSVNLIVEPGLAISACGDVLELGVRTEVDLVRAFDQPPPAGGSFATCLPPSDTSYASQGGVFVLLLTPITVPEGRTPIHGLGRAPDHCNVKHLVSAVQFRLARITLPNDVASSGKRLRNKLADASFGSAAWAAPWTAPYGTTATSTSPLAVAAANEVPLAVISWTPTEGIGFVDRWLVRRRPAGPRAAKLLETQLADRVVALGEARLLQFHEHLEDVRREPTPRSTTLREFARYAPPAALVPIASTSAPAGFEEPTFFSGLKTRRGIFVEAAKIAAILRESLTYAPIDLESKEVFWVHYVRENRQAPSAQPYVLIVSAKMPYFGEARFDASYWNFASYG